MNRFRLTQWIAVLTMIAGIATIGSHPAFGTETMSTTLVGKNVNGHAWYITYGENSVAFFVTVEGARPFAEMQVAARRGSKTETISVMQADAEGRARLTMYSSIPELNSKDLIEVRQGARVVAAGQLAVIASPFAERTTTISTELVGKSVSGSAWHITYGPNSRAFFVSVNGAKAKAELQITMRRESKLERITAVEADKNGNARLIMYSSAPQLQPDDVIEIWHNGRVVASGRMAEPATENK